MADPKNPPCPFCKGTDIDGHFCNAVDGYRAWIQCNTCKARGPEAMVKGNKIKALNVALSEWKGT